MLHSHLHLEPLQVCRQIYHEAVLKPFSVNEFHYIVPQHYIGKTRLQHMVETLVPAQARAIKCLHLIWVNTTHLRSTLFGQLKGLDHVDIQMALSRSDLWKTLADFSDLSGVMELSKLQLKSLRITTEVRSDVVLASNPDETAVIAWQKRLESKLLKTNAMNDDRGLPADQTAPIDP